MKNSWKNIKPVNDFCEESKVTTFSLSLNDSKDDFIEELSLDDTNSITFTFEKEAKIKVETQDVNVLHYKIDDEELLYIPNSNNNLENCVKEEDLIKSCYNRVGCSSYDIKSDSETDDIDDIVSKCLDKSDGCSNIKSENNIDLKINDIDILQNVDSVCSDRARRLKCVIDDNVGGPFYEYNVGNLKKKPLKREYRCTIGSCRRTFKLKSFFKQHQLLHAESKFKCKYCGKVLRDIPYLKKHELAHFNEKGFMIYYPCLVVDCNEEFCSFELLREHEISHNSSSNLFLCEICDKSFSNRNSYVSHLPTHYVDTSYKCWECGKTFISSAVLMSHKRTHMLVKRFNCNLCDAGFHKHSNYLRHIEIHNSRKYICKICKASYHYSRSLTRHMNKEHPADKKKKLEFLNNFKKKKDISCLRTLRSHLIGKVK